LGGNGTLGNTTINGGTLAPGNSIGTITVNGNLVFGPGSTYDVEVSPVSADRTDVTGSATLDGTVHAIFQAGSYMDHSYTILSAAAGLGGTTFDSLSTTNLPSGFDATLDYSGNDVVLILQANGAPPSPSGGLPRNQQNAINAITTFFNNGGSLPPGFVTLVGLTGEEEVTALSQISGEAAAAAQHGVSRAMNQFLDLMLDPVGSSAMNQSFPSSTRSGGVMVPISYATEPQLSRWSVWGGAYGGMSGADGAPTSVGSHGFSSRIHGFGAGMDYQDAPDTAIGLGISGGGTSWNLSDDLGGGKSTDIEAGIKGITHLDPLYIAAAVAYAFHEISTDRFTFGGDRLTASFNAHGVGGRLESGVEMGEVTPYAAVQAQAFYTPGYVESDPAGSALGLSYDERLASRARGEVGSRFNHTIPLDEDDIVLNLIGRLAYARDWVGDPSLTASFQALPGAGFTVSSAALPKNRGIASVGADLCLGAASRSLAGWRENSRRVSSTTAALAISV
jgi:outer membrane autotransporter protein